MKITEQLIEELAMLSWDEGEKDYERCTGGKSIPSSDLGLNGRKAVIAGTIAIINRLIELGAHLEVE